MVALPGDDHLPVVGDQDSILAAVERFIGELHDWLDPTRVLATCLFVRSDCDIEGLAESR